MKKVVKGILLMSILTVIYISGVVYANSNSAADGWVMGADEYEGQPPSWYTPEELGITVSGERIGWVVVTVPSDINYTELEKQQPIFKYKDKFYQISTCIGTPAIETKGWLILGGVCIAGGWIYVGYFGLRKRREATSIMRRKLLFTMQRQHCNKPIHFSKCY